MGYDQDKDKLIKLFESTNNEKSFLCSIFSYNNGPAKLGLTRSFLKNDGTVGYSQAGRLSISDLEFLRANIDEIIKIIKENS